MPFNDRPATLNPRGDRCLPFLFFALPLMLLAAGSCRTRTDEAANRPFITLRDDFGNTVSLPSPPRHILSLSPGTTEILFALGLDSALAGVTDVCDYPPEARNLPSVGGMTSPSFERIVELQPDLILMTVAGNARTDYEKLVSLGFPTFVTNPSSLDGIYKSITDIGRLTQRTTAADSIVAALRSDQEEIRRIASGHETRSVLLLLSLHPLIAAGPGTFLDELIRSANGVNAASRAPTAYPMLSREEVLELQPDVILATTDVATSLAEIRNAYPEWRSLRAVAKNRIAIVDANLISRPGPRITRGLRALVLALHP